MSNAVVYKCYCGRKNCQGNHCEGCPTARACCAAGQCLAPASPAPVSQEARLCVHGSKCAVEDDVACRQWVANARNVVAHLRAELAQERERAIAALAGAGATVAAAQAEVARLRTLLEEGATKADAAYETDESDAWTALRVWARRVREVLG